MGSLEPWVPFLHKAFYEDRVSYGRNFKIQIEVEIMVIVGYSSWRIKDMEFFGISDAIRHIEAQGGKNIPGTNQWEYPDGTRAYLKKY